MKLLIVILAAFPALVVSFSLRDNPEIHDLQRLPTLPELMEMSKSAQNTTRSNEYEALGKKDNHLDLEEPREATEENRSKDCTEDLCKLYGPEHTLCKPKVGRECGGPGILTEGLSPEEQREIVDYSNRMRSKIAHGEQAGLPSAANMRALRWNPDLATTAQRWADQMDPAFRSVGQNIYMSYKSRLTSDTPVRRAVDVWYDEVKVYDQSPGAPYSFDFKSGHFTQLVWADTREVGCGYSIYRKDGLYYKEIVCNYGPGGNVIRDPMYKEGPPCSACPSGTTCDRNGLCA